jgi:hypothetical protein
MRFFTRWQNDAAVMLLALFAGCFLWLGNKAMDRGHEDGAVSIWGGKLPEGVEQAVRIMGEDLENSEVLAGGTERVLFLNAGRIQKDYHFLHGELWTCGRLAASGISSLAFEYRDGAGNRVDPSRKTGREIAFVSCMMGFDTDDGRVFSRIRIPVARSGVQGREIHSLAFAGR